MSGKIKILIAVVLIICGCKDPDLDLRVRFDRIDGLTAGDGVWFENNRIGSVENVVLTNTDGYIANIVIRKNFVNAATRDSRFFLVRDPIDPEGKKGIEIELEKKGGVLLKKGEMVDGSVRPSLLADFLEDMEKKVDELKKEIGKTVDGIRKEMEEKSGTLQNDLDSAVKDLKQWFDQFSRDLSDLPEQREFKELEDALERLAEELASAGKSARESLKKEFLPQLKEEMDRLRERLEKYGKEKEMDPLEEKMDRIISS